MSRLINNLNRLAYWLAWPFFWLGFHGSQRAKVFVFYNGKAAMVNGWVSDGSWDLPGGGIGARETAAEAAGRELEEELGLKLEKADIIFVGTHPCRHHRIPTTIHYFYTCLSVQPTIKRRRFEIRSTAWLSVDELAALPSPIVTEGLALLKAANLLQ